jgi:Tfp pilus assembly protein PilZ
MGNRNLNQRENRRFKYEAVIWHDNIVPGRFYAARISNISSSGIYFESDQPLYQGEKIFVGSKDPQACEHMAAHSAAVEIKWRRELETSRYRFGYGAEFLKGDNPLLRSIDKKKLNRAIAQDGRCEGGRQDPREYLREFYRKDITFVSQNRTYHGRIANISRGGAFIETEIQFSLGQPITFLLRADKGGRVLDLRGWVVRLSPGGIGIKFDRRSGRDRRKNADRRGRRKNTT